ncbi:MAG: hypothetical protein PHI34_00915 [Acidobacteriota bacterium]|nr:hypothetical protein [Acidobacteriota bacterium]
MKKRAAAVLALAWLTAGWLAGQEGRPDAFAALTASGAASELRALASTAGSVGGFLLPPLRAGLGDRPDWTLNLETLALLQELFPGADRVWLRLEIQPAAPGATAKETEEQVRLLTEDVAGRIAPPLAGIVLEPAADVPADLLKLITTSLSLALMAGGKAVPLALTCQAADQLGLAMAAHIDRIVVETDTDWLPSLRHLADLRILRPTLWLVRGGGDRSGGEAYIETMLAAVKYRADMIALDPGSPEKTAELAAAADRIQARIGGGLSILVDDVPLFRLEDKAGARPAQAVFIDEAFDTVMVLARLDAPKPGAGPWRFVSGTGESYEAVGIDPLAAPTVKPVPQGTANVVWERPYLLLQATKMRTTDLRFRNTVDVSARASLSVSEVIARWQRVDAQLKRRLRHYTAAAQMDMHFAPPGLGSGFDVALQFRFFWKNDGSQYWEQTAQYLNGIKLPQTQMFPLPQLEPDKVVVRPLEMRLVDRYAYALDGMEKVDGRECYVVSFRPKPDAKELLYSGRIWIDADTFRRVRMQLIQDRSSGSVIGQTEMQIYEVVTGRDGGQWDLLVRTDVRQKMLAAGREFLLERRYEFKDFTCNGADYADALQAAFRGERPMLAETAGGLRELVKDKSGERQVKEKAGTSVWSLITGLIYTGTFKFPIPMLGISAIDGDFLKSGGQLSTFWAGPIFALNYSKKNKSALTWGADLFLSALPRQDRAYRDGARAENEEVYLFSEGLGGRLRWQPNVWFSATFTEYLIYEFYLPTKSTADDFVMPKSGFTLNPNLGLAFTSGGYEASFEVGRYDRLGWHAWGLPDDLEEGGRSFTRAFGKLGKQFYLGSFFRAGADIGYYTGYGLDRFSCYQPSMFSTPKLRGIPSGTVSMDWVASLSLNVGFTAFDLIRIDAYYSFSRCRENGSLEREFGLHGLEFDFGTIGPWKSYIQGIVSVAVHGLPADYKSRVSVYLLMFIPL